MIVCAPLQPQGSALDVVVPPAPGAGGGHSIPNPWWEDQITQHPVRTIAVTTVAVSALVLGGWTLAAGGAGAGATAATGGATVGAAGATAAAAKAIQSWCFAAGTLVNTEAGLVHIESIKDGDLVWARNAETGEVALRSVLRHFATPQKPVLEVVLADGDGGREVLKVTAEHPFWVRDGGWKRAGELRETDEVFSLSGRWLSVARLSQLHATETVYNFEVEGFHTYFVGALGAWVHNDCWEQIAEHVINDRGRFSGQTVQQAAQYLRSFAETATPTVVQSGATIWRRGAEILILRPGAGPGGTWFQADSSRAALDYMQRFIITEGGAKF